MRSPEHLPALAMIDAAIARLESVSNCYLCRAEIHAKYRAELRLKDMRKAIHRGLRPRRRIGSDVASLPA